MPTGDCLMISLGFESSYLEEIDGFCRVLTASVEDGNEAYRIRLILTLFRSRSLVRGPSMFC